MQEGKKVEEKFRSRNSHIQDKIVYHPTYQRNLTYVVMVVCFVELQDHSLNVCHELLNHIFSCGDHESGGGGVWKTWS